MHILLVRLRLVGDVVFTTPLVRAVRRQFPHSRLTYLVEPAAAAVVRANPHLDDVIVAPRSRGLRRLADDLRLARQLRRSHIDVALDLHGGPRSAFLTRASGAKIRIGYDIPGRWWAYTKQIPRPRELRARHSVENQWDLLAALDASLAAPPDPRRDAVEMRVDDSAAERSTRRLAAAGVKDQHDVIVIHVSAGNPFRRWPEESFAQLATELAARDPQRRIVFTSGPSDRGAAGRIAALARARLGPDAARAIVEHEDFDLAELHAVISRATLFIGGDSGPLHVAATTETPIVGLYGPTLPVRSSAWRDPASVIESVELADLPCRPCDQRVCGPGDFRCLTRLEPSAVAMAAERALERAATRLKPRRNDAQK